MTERKRATGFILIDAAFTSDAKFVRLARRVPDPVAFASCIGVYLLVLADCRRAKSPLIDWADYSEYELQLALLRDSVLLTDAGFDPASFEKWAPAYRSPFDKARAGKGGTPVRNGTNGTNTSSHISSSLEEGVQGEEQGVWNGSGLHDGRHGVTCQVCLPLLQAKA